MSNRAQVPTQPLTQLEFTPADFELAHRMATALGYGDPPDAAYTSTSALWGLFCMAQNPNSPTRRTLRAANCPPMIDGCVISTKELGLLFVVLAEDLHWEGGDR